MDNLDLINEFETYYLGDGENYFKYRKDKYDNNLWRATLFNQKKEKLADISITGKTHFQVINYFEVFISKTE